MEVSTSAGTLSESQRESFERDGILVLDDPCAPELIDTVVRDAEDLLQDAFHPGPEVLDDGVVFSQHQGGVETYHWHRVMNAWKLKRSIRDLALAPKVLAVTEELFGRRVLPFQTLNFPVGTEQPPHIDAFFFHSDPAGYMCGVWIALEDMDMDNGPLVYYPGSHKLPLPEWSEIAAVTGRKVERSDHSSEEDFRNERAVAFSEYARHLIEKHGYEPKYATVRKGQAVIWAPNILHGGAPQNDKSRTRHSQVSHYYFEGCRHYSPLHTEGSHIFWRYPEWIREPPPDNTPDAIRTAVEEKIPAGATVLVGGLDDGFPELTGRPVHAFPQDDDGNQIPLRGSGEAAVEQLEQRRSEGAHYIVVPKGQLWELESGAPELQEHLESRYQAAMRDGAYGVIYDLRATN